MKKICLVFNTLTDANGVARAAVAIANLLASSGKYKVTLVPLYSGKAKFSGTLEDKVKVSPFLPFYFKGLPHLVALLPPKILYKLVVKETYDLEIGFQFGLATKIIASSPNVSKVAWMHGYDYGLKLRDYYPKFKRVLCVSKFNANKLKQELNKPELDIDYCYNTIDDRKVCELGQETISANLPKGFKFVSVGRLSNEKGYSRLPKIVNKLKNEGYSFSIVLVGDGPLKSQILEEINQYGINDYFYFCGTQTNPHKFTSICDVFICPSYSEGYSNACTEAVMLGVPVLTTSVPGGEEIINDADCGLLVDNTDDSIYEGMRYILDNQELVTNWKARIKETKYKFSQSYRTERLLNIIEQSIQK